MTVLMLDAWLSVVSVCEFTYARSSQSIAISNAIAEMNGIIEIKRRNINDGLQKQNDRVDITGNGSSNIIHNVRTNVVMKASVISIRS